MLLYMCIAAWYHDRMGKLLVSSNNWFSLLLSFLVRKTSSLCSW